MSSLNRAALAAIVALLPISSACSGKLGPRPQWKVELVTDAAVPQVGQAVLAEFIDDSGNLTSSAARRTIDGSTLDRWPISFGFVPTASDEPGPRLHVVFYRLDETERRRAARQDVVHRSDGDTSNVECGYRDGRVDAFDELLRRCSRSARASDLRSYDRPAGCRADARASGRPPIAPDAGAARGLLRRAGRDGVSAGECIRPR